MITEAAFVSAGNTGAAVATSYFRLGTIPGVDLPALVGPFPTATGTCLVLDIGANADCKPEYLAQFARMGAIYMEKIHGIQRPSVGLMTNGREPRFRDLSHLRKAAAEVDV